MKSIFKDVEDMHAKYEFPKFDLCRLADRVAEPGEAEMSNFRFNFIQEEFDELIESYNERDPIGVIDACIDLMFVITGYMSQLNISAEQMQAHWDEVLRANMDKVRGPTKRGDNTHDIMKLADWVGPNHEKIIKEMYDIS